MSPRHRRPLPLLAPLGWLYLRASALHHGLYDRHLRRPGKLEIPVVSVGNLTAGGTGKTPMTLWLAENLAGRGRRVGVVSRGYGGVRRADPLVVARGPEILAGPEQAGDEPVMIARRKAAACVVVGRDRLEAGRMARQAGAELVILDDGFQHRRLHRDFDLLLVDAADPWGGGRGLPAGLLREPVSAVRRADAVVLTRCEAALAASKDPVEPEQLPPALASALAPLDPRRRPPVFASTHVFLDMLAPDGQTQDVKQMRGQRVLAVSAIARPESFAALLESLGLRVVEHLAWPDHHRFDGSDAAEIVAVAGKRRARWIVTTEKDAVRWPTGAPRPTVLRVGLALGAAEPLLTLIESRLFRSDKEPS